jgi:hypothetical protein
MIVRLGISSAAVGLASLPAFFLPACLGSNSSTADAGPGGGSSSGGSSSGSSSGGSSGGSSSGTGDGGALGVDILDDMSTPAVTTGGYWYTYSDRTCPNTALLMASAPGTINPSEGLDFKPAGDTVNIPAPGPGDVNYREVTGGGEKTWGVGFGFNFTNDPGPNPFANCDGGCMGTPPATDAAVGFANKWDASMHKGFAFWAKLVSDASSPLKVNVQIADKHTHPNGGTCNPCLNGGPMACADDYIESKPISTSQIQVMWTDTGLKQVGWSTLKGVFDPTSLFYIHLQVQGAAAAPAPAFDIQVAYFTWVD